MRPRIARPSGSSCSLPMSESREIVRSQRVRTGVRVAPQRRTPPGEGDAHRPRPGKGCRFRADEGEAPVEVVPIESPDRLVRVGKDLEDLALPAQAANPQVVIDARDGRFGVVRRPVLGGDARGERLHARSDDGHRIPVGEDQRPPRLVDGTGRVHAEEGETGGERPEDRLRRAPGAVAGARPCVDQRIDLLLGAPGSVQRLPDVRGRQAPLPDHPERACAHRLVGVLADGPVGMQEGRVEQQPLEHTLRFLPRRVRQDGLSCPRGPGEDGARPARLDGKVTEHDEGLLGEVTGVLTEQQPDLLHHVPALEPPRPLRDVGDDVRVRFGGPRLHQRHAGGFHTAEDVQLPLQLGKPLRAEDIGVGGVAGLHQPGVLHQ